MVMSQDRLEQEHAMINRIVVGLVHDGNQIIRIVPTSPTDELSPYEKAVSLTKRISTPIPVSWILRNTRRDEIVQQLEKIDLDGIVAFGSSALQVAQDVGIYLGVPILKEVITMREANRVRKKSPVDCWLAATPSMARVISNRVGEDRVTLAPIAAATSSIPTTNIGNKNRCVSVLEASAEPRATKQILESLKQFEDVHIFLELTGKKQQSVWKVINQLDMHSSVTCLRDMASLRSLIIESDLILMPSPSMPVRTIFLETMLASIPIIATTIEGFDMLIDDETALIVKEAWDAPIQRILGDGPLAKRIGQEGRRLIEEKYASSAQIAAFEAAFRLV